MKKFLLVIMMFAFCIGLVKAADPVVMKIGHCMTTATARHKAALAFKEYAENESKGALKVEIYPAAQLGKEAEMLEAVKMGSIEGYLGGIFEAITPMLNLYLMPFLFPNADALAAVETSDLGAKINKSAEQYGIKVLMCGNAGSRNYTNNIRPIKTPADMVGLKMRTPPTEAIIKTMEAVGGNPVSIAYVETYMALKTGVADGQENPFMNIVTMKFHEVQKYMTVVHYEFHPEPFVVNLDWFNSLTPELQTIITEGAKLYVQIQNKIRAESSDSYLKTIEDSGVEVYYPTEEERALFVEKCKPVYDAYIEKGDFTQADLDQAREIVKNF